MRRLFIVLVLGMTAVVWPAASSAAATGARAQAVGDLEADFNNDGLADLAIGVPGESIGALTSGGLAGAVNVLYGSAGGLTGNGSQVFWQGPGGVAGTAEADDQFGLGLINSDD